MDTALRMAHFAPCMHSIACLGDYFFVCIRPGVLQDFYASVHAAMARAVKHEHSWVRRGSVQHPRATAPHRTAHQTDIAQQHSWPAGPKVP